MNRHPILFALLALLLYTTACRKNSQNCGLECSLQEEMLFQTNFEGTLITNEGNSARLSGTDLSLDSLSDWAALEAHPNIGSVNIYYEDGDLTQRFADITTDPENPNNKVLHFKISEPHIDAGGGKEKGRVQLNLSDNQCIKEYYQTVKLYLHPDMAYLKQWQEEITWLSLFEFWNNANWTGEKHPFRVTVNLVKTETGVTDDLYFQVKGDHQSPFGKWQDDWRVTAEDFSVPFGQWMELELYIREGNADNGRFYLSVTPEGGPKTVLFDLTNNTQHSKEKCPDGFSHFHPLKLYTSDRLIKFMNDNGKNLDIYWDAWKVYLNREP